jgi:hypothetical protein
MIWLWLYVVILIILITLYIFVQSDENRREDEYPFFKMDSKKPYGAIN